MINDRFRRFHKAKLSIDFDDQWGDLVPLYKSRSFDENSQIMVTINGSVSTVDAGGPRRQVYTKVYHEFATNCVINLFEGENINYLRPVISAEVRSCGILKILGKIVAHSICQEGIGFPYFSPTCYWYIVGGEEMAIEQSNLLDLPPGSAVLLNQVIIMM